MHGTKLKKITMNDSDLTGFLFNKPDRHRSDGTSENNP